jgi:hypothetical protein
MIKQRKNYEEYLAKMKLFNKLFYVTKEKLVDFEFRKKRGEKIKKKYEHQLLNDDSKTTLDPGKYFPKYKLIQRRYPVAYLGGKNDNEKKNNNKTRNKIKINNDIKNNIIKENKNLSVSNFYSIKNRKNILKDKEYKEKEGINYKKYYKRNRASSLPKTSSINNNSSNFEKQKTLDVDNNKFNNNMFLSTTNINKNMNMKNQYNTKKLFKSSSAENINKIKCPIVFNKMPGRDRSVVIEPSFNEDGYSPNYESTRPHVPAIIFKRTFDFQKFKKYMTGKIIRNYCFTPDKYFVFEVNRNKNNNSLNETHC